MRLLRGEVEQFGKTGRVRETIRFGTAPDDQLNYILQADSRAQQISTCFADNQITVLVPAETARNWVDSDEVTLKNDQPIAGIEPDGSDENSLSESVLKILIEKDFICLDRRDDPDNADAFPHPTGKCA